MATGETMTSTARSFLVSIQVVSNIIPEMAKLIWESLSPVVFEPFDTKKMLEISRDFYNSRGFPHIVGAVDGKHVKIKNFARQGSTFFNYKSFFSVVLMAVCDAHKKFVFVDIGAPGSLSDGHVWKQTSLHKKIENGEIKFPEPSTLPKTGVKAPYFFLGDEAFGLSEHMLVPFRGKASGNLTDQEINFNHHHSSSRICIENAFGIMSARWRVFLNTIEASESTVKLIIQLGVVLHNWMLETKPLNNYNHYQNEQIKISKSKNEDEGKALQENMCQYFKKNKFLKR